MSCFIVVTIALLGTLLGGRSHTPLEHVVAAVFQFGATAALVRALFLGVYASTDGVKIVSWFQTRHYRWRDLRRSDAIPYDGLLSKGIETRLLSVIQVTLADGDQIAIYSTFGPRRRLVAQANALNRLIQNGGPARESANARKSARRHRPVNR